MIEVKVIKRIFRKLGLGRKPTPRWPDANVSPEVVLEGDINSIHIGMGTLVEPGAVFVNQYGGSITIGQHCEIRRSAMIISFAGQIVLGDYCSVNPYTVLYGHGGLFIGNYVRIAANTTIIPANHRFDSLDKPIHLQGSTKIGIHIDDDVWIGAGVNILDGVHIGEGAVIGAGSVVNKDIPSYSINVGNPCRTIRMRK